jgi:hypothetical protein
MKSIKIYSFVSLRKAKKTICFAVLLSLAAFFVWRAGDASAQKGSFAPLNKGQTAESKIFSEFDEWIRDYSEGNFANESEFIRNGEAIARNRRESFKELIRMNPRKAIETAISEETQKRLPVSITQFLEERISATGDFNVVAIDRLDESNNQVEREFVANGERYKAFVYGRKTSMTTKLEIGLGGVVLDDLMAVDEDSARVLSSNEIAARNISVDKFNKEKVFAEVGGKIVSFANKAKFDEYARDLVEWETKISPSRNALSPWTEGAKTLLFIRIDFPDRPGEPLDRFGQYLSLGAAQNLIDGAVNEFYVNNSYQKTSLRATVTPVVRMPQPQSSYPRENLYNLVTDARNAARAAGFETNNFDLDMVAYSYTTLHNFSGISPIANKGALLNGNFTFKVATHELGHAYGLMHANLWRNFDGTIIGEGANIEYGDDFDMMGRGATQETHFNASYKRNLEWLKETNVQNVTQSGVYRVFAHDSTTADPTGVRALKITKDISKDYWIEFRQQLTNYPNLMEGALIRWDSEFDGWRRTQLLDMYPSTTSLADSSLNVGQTFTDNESGITITVLSKNGTSPESLDIKVEFNYSIINGAPFDFDGDAKTDLSIFRPNAGEWWYRRSMDNESRAFQFGNGTDKINAADFTGDGKADIAFFRPSTGFWFVLRSEDNSFYSFPFGANGDIPIAADFDGDDRADAAVFRADSATWFVNKSSGGTIIQQFGANGDAPQASDYDSDGKADIAIYRPANGEWWIQRSRDGLIAFQFGSGADKPVPADYTGDGKTDVAVWRQSTGEWFVLRSENQSFYAAPFGQNGDIPVAGDYDGDGRADFAVFRPSDANWYLLRSQNGFIAAQFGAGSDLPVPAGANR